MTISYGSRQQSKPLNKIFPFRRRRTSSRICARSKDRESSRRSTCISVTTRPEAPPFRPTSVALKIYCADTTSSTQNHAVQHARVPIMPISLSLSLAITDSHLLSGTTEPSAQMKPTRLFTRRLVKQLSRISSSPVKNSSNSPCVVTGRMKHWKN